jgi:hypothetical protein
MDIGDEHLLCVVQGPQEGGFLTVTGVDTDPREPHPPGARLAHDVQGMRTLRRQLARGLWDPGLIASRWVLDPACR